MRRDSRRFVQSLDLPPAGSIRELLPAIEQRTGCPIHLLPAPAGSAFGVCGMWIRTVEDMDYIFIHEDTSRAHQDHILAHEIAHILRNHHENPAFSPVSPVPERLFPNIDPEVVRMMLGRSEYTYRDEREAELIGSYLQRHVHRRTRQIADHDRAAETLLRRRT
ncbi:ImmA/IrrE family metallo-endopeptidase [Streptomyces sp. HNM0663]|uniref:ImmA/IrrE family metallo-endopeptidase n=1 Tax=Streptomyces chengmaiensis TaxID=3040919 RepID=A0ABT6HGL6_9ACTN|nr:ImmA/IrrE family metallo-endopeptidase [Streptomyces chengmaiensis]MDH2387422.1 ImmA/IrrE family metallo-endopeptidase [Streptomyces chengmaiensis]